MRAFRRLMLTAATAWAALSAPNATATTVLKLDVPTMTRLSSWVVKARVTDITYVDLRSVGERLYTDISLSFEEVYKGEARERYVLRLIGGRGADGMALTVPGMPHFTKGERVVLFLEPTLRGHVPCGLGQGVWRIASDARGELWVQQDSHDLHMMQRSPSGRLVDAPGPQMTQALTLGELIAEVYAAQLATATPAEGGGDALPHPSDEGGGDALPHPR